MSVTIDSSFAGIDWEQAKADLIGRQLRQRSHGRRSSPLLQSIAARCVRA